MKLLTTLIAVLPALSSAHSIAQRVRVNGLDNGELVGIRVPTSNNPILSVTDQNIACNSGYSQPVSTKVIDVKAGDKVGVQWGHVIGGAQYPNDLDHPIASSHKGPTIFYMAKVDNATTASPTGLKWFKVAEDGLDSAGKWGVDRMIAASGWQDMTLPTCLAPGQYLLRAEIIALHSASSVGAAQFYMGCAQIKVSGSGTTTGTPTVSFPGAYLATDPGILVSIYNNQGQPVGNGQPYKIPGPTVFKC
ncbi:lytic polysaccharide monooxygenase [Dothidotthia symphoricarpi CBS 119687]|uniref:AA9 family lytic polysaccharide monooxygenase n=1 Tax=Dothidotthia symphoricarpi CBS 119687 TaxID=1392245 RepID=A0A6A6AFS8_9PLEO|nr:lytic polysaccharide monooxygenase [Dothidotthia symphoricarpi CBS 119687]KAF2129794.1 lytic polysaccharide monooxygenase [Dothidotthia symphoricarpi CBS 119687]